ncbi:hypothetical protein [uncultured Clostridium sp.]|uniref:hypothetical protein n=2 Tax=Clostridium TaxID=1485 RepID=UPI002607F082|nr:hypothetical protein [uncultured Clostridium sp.]
MPKSDELWSAKMTTEDGTELQYTLDGVDAGALEKLKADYKSKSDLYLSDPSNDIRDILAISVAGSFKKSPGGM